MGDPHLNAIAAVSVANTPTAPIAATTVQAAIDELASEKVQGVAGGYKLARGTGTLDGSGATSVAHGLTTCVAAVACLKGTAAPGSGDGTRVLVVNVNGSAIDVYPFKPTSGTDPTLVASDGTEEFYWIAVGT